MGGELVRVVRLPLRSPALAVFVGVISLAAGAKAAPPEEDDVEKPEESAEPAASAEPKQDAEPVPDVAPKADQTATPSLSASTNQDVQEDPLEAPAPEPPPSSLLLSKEPGWEMGFSGFVELDAIADSTQSFSETLSNNTIARPHTIAGDNPRVQWTARDSRLGFKVTAPTFESMKAWALLEMDFFGTLSPTATQDQSYAAGPIRLRQYYAKLETPIVDVLAGQTQDLFGWGGAGFFPSTPAFLGVLGEVFHRNPQLRVSKGVGGDSVGFEVAVAGTRPATRDSGTPDLQGGMKIAFNDWQGASAQGPRRATTAPLALGVSGVLRRLAVTDFSAVPGDPQVATGWGAAIDAFLPIIPADGKDLSNTLSVTAEFSMGTGISDLYNTLTGGVLFPALANPHNTLPAPSYTPNIDQGIVTFDANAKLHTIDRQGLMVNAHYHLPFREGKMLGISGTYSQISSSNALEFTPTQGRDFVWDKGWYIDATVWWCITPAFQMALSGQRMSQTFGDGTEAVNNRGEVSSWFFF